MPITVQEAQKHIEKFHELAKKRDLEAIMKGYADDAVLMPDHHPILKGKADIEKWYKMWWERDPKGEFDVKLTVMDVHEHGDRLIIRGKAVMSIKDKNFNGKWIHVWEKQGEECKLHFGMWNGDEEVEEFAKLMPKKK